MKAPSPKRIAKGMYWDRAWSLVEGCTPVSLGCDNCWSAAQAHMRAGQRNEKIRARYAGLTTEKGQWNGQIRILRENLELPMKRRKPTVWAVWNDLFHEGVQDSFIIDVFARMGFAKQHVFLILTKRPNRMLEFFKAYKGNWPLPNVGLGVTAENDEQLWRIKYLLHTPAATRFVSVEPMLGPVLMEPWLLPNGFEVTHDHLDAPDGAIYGRFKRSGNYWNPVMPRIDWVICGAESGPGRRQTNIEWIFNLRDQCLEANVPFFLKQAELNGKLLKMPKLDGWKRNEIPGNIFKT